MLPSGRMLAPSPARGCPQRQQRLDDGALTGAGNAFIEQRFQELEANPHASVPLEEAKHRLMAWFKR
jgi:hypothetical protein